MRQSIAKLSKMPENLRGYLHGKSANQTHEPIKKDVISSGRERLRCWFVSRKYRALMSQAFCVRHTQFKPCSKSSNNNGQQHTEHSSHFAESVAYLDICYHIYHLMGKKARRLYYVRGRRMDYMSSSSGCVAVRVSAH